VIEGNQNWQNALAQLQKQPLYTLEIPAYGIVIASFSSVTQVTVGGYGIILYGASAYGT
jgi:hypothetical protein